MWVVLNDLDVNNTIQFVLKLSVTLSFIALIIGFTIKKLFQFLKG